MARDRKLSREERILWGKVARTTKPLPGRMDAFAEEREEDEFGDMLAAPVSPPIVKAKPDDWDVPSYQAPPQEKPKGIHHPLERPVKRKLQKGHLPLEGRIDLHGLVQSEAHNMLLDFIIRAHERGMRHVLVITGKGRSMGSDGALKRAVPIWFRKPEFRFLISSYETAADRHGGEGAIYVRLSRVREDRT